MLRRTVLKAFGVSLLAKRKKGTMPFGEAPGQGFNNSSVVVVNKLIVEGTGDGVFVYNGTPALGNSPVISITEGIVDPYGNTVVPGVTTYDSSGDSNTLSSSTLFFRPAGAAAPGTIQAVPGEILISSGAKVSGFDPVAEISLQDQSESGITSGLIQLLAGKTQLIGGATAIPVSSAGVVTVPQVLAMLRTAGICT